MYIGLLIFYLILIFMCLFRINNKKKYNFAYICDNIWIGDLESSYDIKQLNDLNIKNVIYLDKIKKSNDIYIKYNNNNIDEKIYYFNKNSKFPVEIIRDKIYDEIYKSPHNLLIHSVKGDSRVIYIICYYLMRTRNWSFERSEDYIKNKYGNNKLEQFYKNKLSNYNKYNNKN